MQLTKLFNKDFIYFLLSYSQSVHIPELEPSSYDIDQHTPQNVLSNTSPRPVVLWHGLGDNFNSSFIHRASQILDVHYPGIYVFPISLGETPSDDQHKSFFGDANIELEDVCEQLRNNTILQDGFDAVGFSQGGLFLRALVERCSGLKVHNLITFGSPHNGVSELPLCEDPSDWVCKTRNSLLKKQVWYDTVQKRVIPAQYFRDPYVYETYLKHSNFLADVNNEKEIVNQTYKENFQNLNKLILIDFTQDTTLVPKDSAWFYDSEAETGETLEFTETRIYKEVLIGLQKLYKENRIDFLSIEEDHMRITDEYFNKIAIEYLGK
ncbi:Alpha/Beta hydrolase protein [Scheffersomyces amazonensis]|uniref:Alpha/Beta hydrolase protein n=1 Tax=Scheffersomyces amazonensis TaxID=1078765 RepID=UPI00315CCB8D